MKTLVKLHLTGLVLAALAMPAAFAQEGRSSHFAENGSEIIHHRMYEGNSASVYGAPTVGSTSPLSRRSQLTNHGGQVITTPTAYIIWYGNWAQGNGTDTAGGQQIISDFFNAIGGSPYFKINSTYTGSGITGNVTYGGATSVAYPYGASLSDANIQSIVSDAITGGHLPNDATGIYFVLTSSDVNESSGFCTQYCGWHSWGTINGSNHRYAFIGNAARCITSCAAQSVGPNGNAGVDGMVSVLAHELEEATTDPDGKTWYARTGYENGDDCAWTFGTSTLGSNGAYYNVTMGSRNYLIQRNVKFVGSSQYCLMQ
ncbi:hypothetical protein GETHLI_32730 [Geothrix limicola]|uniref:Uncharacterized protein n=1 Tax=Geothrix limicola TaxID=2927978 RepID=A0ABQ5QKD5_9BACT|nr:hypothetical protein [Geothrix limicola]GLH74771.1 hypothetical protein GETHLI_32730 [Geothrix limicola]